MKTFTQAVGIVVLASTVSAAPATQYTLVDLGPVTPNGFGEEGMVIGTMGRPEQAAILHPIVKPIAYLPGGQVSRGYARHHQCNVGSSQALVNGIHHGFRDCGAGVEALPSPAGSHLGAAAFALFGQAVGGICEGEGRIPRPCFWQRGQAPVFLATLGGQEGAVYAMTADVRVGVSQTAAGVRKATRWVGGFQHPEDLDEGGPGPSQANDINMGWQIVGWAQFPEGIRAFLWDNTVLTNLGTLPTTTSSRAMALNDAGEIVGASQAPSPMGSGLRAVFFHEGTVTDLNTRITGTGIRLEVATAIGNDGRILCTGTWQGEPRGFLLTPQVMVQGPMAANPRMPSMRGRILQFVQNRFTQEERLRNGR